MEGAVKVFNSTLDDGTHRPYCPTTMDTSTPRTSSQYARLVNWPKTFWPVDAGIRRHGTN